jgi:ketosteroid isomerase-like protein
MTSRWRDRSRRPTLALVGVAAVTACTIERADVRTPSGEPLEADSVRVRKAVESVIQGFERIDLTALDTLYHDSVVVYDMGAVVRSWAEYRDGRLLPELRALSDRRFRARDIRVRLADGTAWATFRFDFQAARDEQPIAASGAVTMVFEEVGGRWRIVHQHTSSER